MTKTALSKWRAVGLLLPAAVTIWMLGGSAQARQRIVLKTGESIEASQVRVEQTRIWFCFNGLTVSVDKKDVQRIEDGGKTRIVFSTPESGPAAEPENRQPLENTPPDPAVRQKLSRAKPASEGKGKPAEAARRSVSTSPPDSPRRSAARKNKPGRTVRLSAVLKPGGFGDMKWGDRIASQRGLRRLDSIGELAEVVEYVRTDEPLRLETQADPIVRYAFWNDRLYMVTLWAEGPDAYRSIRRAMFERFGPGTPSPDHRQTCYWVDDDADRMIDYLSDRQMGMLWMRSREINHQYQLTRLRIPINAGRSGPAAATR